MCCIQPMMHSCALFCIPEHYGGTIPETECVGMHRTVEPHILTQEKPSGLKAKLTWTDMGWTGWACHKACHKSTHVPLHVSPSLHRMHTRVNASAYTSECVCEWMHLNALECVRMRVRQNATCRQNAPYVGRHTNAFECNSCRMQRTVNAH